MPVSTFVRRLLGLALVAMLLATRSHAQTAPAWASVLFNPSPFTPPTGNGSYGTDIGIDAVGNRYATGTFFGTIQLGTFTFTTVGNSTYAYLVKYSPSGIALWATTFEAGSVNRNNPKVAVDAAGNVYWSGTYSGYLRAGATSFSRAGAFVLKYNTQGVQQWAQEAGGQYTDSEGVAVDAAGNITIMGQFSTSVSFGGTVLTGGGVYYYQLSPTGVALRASRPLPYGSSQRIRMCVDAAGNAYFGGNFFGTATFGNITLNATGYTDMFLCKLTPAGTVAWATLAGSPYQDQLQSMTTDASGNLLVSSYNDMASVSLLPTNLVVALFNTSGTLLWEHTLPTGAGYQTDSDVAYDGRGGYWFCGGFASTVVVGATTLVGRNQNAFAIRYTAQGTPVWAGQGDYLPTSPPFTFFHSDAQAIAADASGNMSLTGSVSGHVTFGALVTMSNRMNTDMYVATISAGPLLTASRSAAPGLVLQAYPNPATGLTTLTLPTGGQLELLDALGRRVRQQALPATAGPCAVPLAGLAPGLYQLRATLGNGQLAHATLQVQ